MFTFYIIAAIANVLVSIGAYFQYIRMRMADRPISEKKWLTIHFITLALFVFFGVLILVHLSNKLNSQHQL